MNSEYTNINKFVDDVHEQISLKNTIIAMGIIKEKNFTLNGFTNCIFHSGDNTPSLQVGNSLVYQSMQEKLPVACFPFLDFFHSICSYKSRKSPFWTYSSYIYQSEHKKRTSCRKSMIFSI